MRYCKHNYWSIGAMAVSHIWLASAGHAGEHEPDHDLDHEHRMELREGHVDLLVLFEEGEGLHLALAAGEHEHEHVEEHGDDHHDDPHDEQDPHDDHDEDHGHAHIELADAVIVGGPAAAALVPAGDGFGFLGVAGDHVFVLPQAEAEHLPFLGLNTEELDPQLFEGDVTLTLMAVDGPGTFFLYQTDAFGLPDLLLDGRGGLAGGVRLPLGTHSHANWAFTWPGEYVLTFVLTALQAGGEVLESEPQRLQVEIAGQGSGWFRGLGGSLLRGDDSGWAWSREAGWIRPASAWGLDRIYRMGATGDWIRAEPAHAPYYWNFNQGSWERWDD
jgi:surface-anchored protein